MHQRQNDAAHRVAHPDFEISRYKDERSCTPVRQRREEAQMSDANDNLKMDQEQFDGHSLDPNMVEAMRIYRSEFWESSSFSWLFSTDPPAWVDTDPAGWSEVKLILQDFKYKDVQRRLSQAKAELKIIQADVTDSDSESTDSCDYPTVRIVSSKGTQKNMKSCLKTRVDLRTNIIKMVIVGSIDIELYSLDEDEIDWKYMPVSLERFEVNGKYIRDISLEEMRVRKVCELGLDLCKDNDNGDSMLTALSRIQLCELYNKKLQSQIAECTLEKPTKTSKSKLPRRQDLSELSGQTSESLLSEKSRTPIIARSQSTKQLVIGRNLPVTQNLTVSSTLTRKQNSGRDERHRDVVTHRRNETFRTDSATAKHITVNLNMVDKIKNSYCEESLTRKSSLGGLIDLSGSSTDYLLKEAIQECSKETDVKDIDKLKSSATSDKQQEKRSCKEGNDKVSLSDSLQSLDELLDDALESQAELERRFVHKFSATNPNSKATFNSAKQQIENEMSRVDKQQKTGDVISEGSSLRVSPDVDYDSLFSLIKCDKRNDISGWKPAINAFYSRDNNINDVGSDGPLTGERHHDRNYREGCQSQRGCSNPRKFQDDNYPLHGISNLDRHPQSRQGNGTEFRLARSWSNLSTSPLLSLEDRNEVSPSRSGLSDSDAENSLTAIRTSHEISSSVNNSCDNKQTHSVEVSSRPGRRNCISFINRKVSSFWKKLRSFNCC